MILVVLIVYICVINLFDRITCDSENIYLCTKACRVEQKFQLAARFVQ